MSTAPDLSAPVPSSPVALLDQLDELRAKATPGEWEHDHEDYGDEWWFGGSSGPGQETINGSIVTDAGHAADAALIVAAVNALPELIADLRKHHAAIRAVLELANDYDDGSEWGAALFRGDVIRTAIRTAITAALSVTP